ncbi:MAG: ATP-binding protein [Candidatus Zhuqueibacterota bacterium]
MNIQLPSSVGSNFDGYDFLIDFCKKLDNLWLEEIILDFNNTSWFEANLLAILGALLNRAENELNTIKIRNLNSTLETLFQRNQFLSHFGGFNLQDYYRTTVKYTKFKSTDEKLFKFYLDGELLSQKALPKMSDRLRKKINESIFEIFNNAVTHGQCQHIFCCGQYYPRKLKLDFTVVDLGVTIKKNVVEYLGNNLSGKQAIKWAVAENNTTKTGSIPGGLGLKLIREFITLNCGKIQIISADGYWEQKENEIITQSFEHEFPGTIVNLEFNIDDKSSYLLSTELDHENIF